MKKNPSILLPAVGFAEEAAAPVSEVSCTLNTFSFLAMGILAVPITIAEASFTAQLIGVASIGAFVVVTSIVTWLVLKYTIGIRCSKKEEHKGLDVTGIGMEAYSDFQKLNA